MNKQKLTVGANVVLGLLGVLLVGIEIGKSASSGNYDAAYTLVFAAIAALSSGNVSSLLNILPSLRTINKSPAKSSSTENSDEKQREKP
jgi:hypothetical protein